MMDVTAERCCCDRVDEKSNGYDLCPQQIGLSPKCIGRLDSLDIFRREIDSTSTVCSKETGSVQDDTAFDGIGDTPFKNVLITVTNAAGDIVGIRFTDSGGNFVFPNLPAGTCTVTQTNSEGYVDVSDTYGDNDSIITVLLGAGVDSTGNIFVDATTLSPIIVLSSISGSVQEDTNNDIMVGDVPLENSLPTLETIVRLFVQLYGSFLCRTRIRRTALLHYCWYCTVYSERGLLEFQSVVIVAIKLAYCRSGGCLFSWLFLLFVLDDSF
jgi:hypothetical protein